MNSLMATRVENLGVKIDAGLGLVHPYEDSMADGAYFITPEISPGWKILKFVCPCGCRQVDTLRLYSIGDRRSNDAAPHWLWDGNRNAPTLSPSINRDRTCGWHGYLQAGTWVSL